MAVLLEKIMSRITHSLFTGVVVVLLVTGCYPPGESPSEIAGQLKEIREVLAGPDGPRIKYMLSRIYYRTDSGDNIADPFRIIDGQFVNLVPQFNQIFDEEPTPSNPYAAEINQWVFVKGKTIQASTDVGAIVQPKGHELSFRNVTVRNYPFSLSDGGMLVAVAKYKGLITYQSILGANLTVRSFDYGDSVPDATINLVKQEIERGDGRPIFPRAKRSQPQEYLASEPEKPKPELGADSFKHPIPYQDLLADPRFVRPLAIVPIISAEEDARRRAAAGDRTRQAEANTIAFLRKRIADGSIDAARDLANRYRKGWGVEVDKEEADKLNHLADVREAQQAQ